MKAAILFLTYIGLTANIFSQNKTIDVQLKNVTQLSQALNYDKYASIAVDKKNTIWVSFTSMKDDKETIVLKSLKNNFWSNEEIIDNGEGVESYSKLLMSSDNKLWIFWQGKRNGKWAIYAKNKNANQWSSESKLTPDDLNCFHPNVIEDSKGNIWLTYEKVSHDRIDIEVKIYNNKKWNKAFTVTNGNVNRRTSLAADKTGKVWIAWDAPVTGNYDIWLSSMHVTNKGILNVDTLIQATKSLSIDDSPSITFSDDGTLWLAYNSLRSLQNESNRSNQHSGAIFLKAYKNAQWFVTEKISNELSLGELSYKNIDKTPNDAEENYWHWKQNQNMPVVYFDKNKRLWVFWRTDMFGAHNFDIWARVYNENAWSDELHLTTFSPGRDEFPSLAETNNNKLYMVWEAQTLPVKGQEEKVMGGFVDAYNTNGNNNVIVFGEIDPHNLKWHKSSLLPIDIEATDSASDIEMPLPSAISKTNSSAIEKMNIYFGDPHSHTVLSDGKYGWPDQIIFLSKKKLGIDFTVISDHAEMGRLQNSEYQELALFAKNFSDNGKYIDLLGFEWTASPAYGHRIVIFPNTTSPNLSAAQEKGNSIEKLYNFLKPYGGIISTHHSGQATWGRWNPNAPFNDKIEPNFEVVSFHGRFEYYKNPHEGRRQVPGHQFQDALKQGRHIGILGGSDTHFLSPGEGGLTAVLSESLTRQNIFDAIKNRRTYATTGVKILLRFSINGHDMGSIFSISKNDSINIHLSINGTAPIDHIEIIKNTEDYFAIIRLQQIPGTTKGVFMIYDPAKPQGGQKIQTNDLSAININLKENFVPDKVTSYYIRITQTDGHQAWSSPIWINNIDATK